MNDYSFLLLRAVDFGECSSENGGDFQLQSLRGVGGQRTAFAMETRLDRATAPLSLEGWGRGWWGAASVVKTTPSPQPSDETTSQSTKPASGQVAGYPARGEGCYSPK